MFDSYNRQVAGQAEEVAGMLLLLLLLLQLVAAVRKVFEVFHKSCL